MNFKDNLKKLRKDNNLSQEELAEKLNVSRQSVSKWESGAAYPEMDKVLQLCKMFDLNIDELLNQNIKEVNNTKESKINVNKYIDDFLSYVTKTINMFSSMKFKDKIKCLFEQIILIVFYVIIITILENILSSIFGSIFSFLPGTLYSNLINIIDGVFYLIASFVGITLLLHIFKTRYLDYYNIVIKDDDSIDLKSDENKDKEVFERKNEKIIIRDPSHSGYKFINGIVKVILFFLKMFAIFVGFWFCLSLISFVVLFVISFLFIKTGFLFLGGLLGLVGCIIINLIILDLIFCFVVNRKCKLLRLFILFITSLVLGGVGIALILIGIKDFKYVEDYNKAYMVTKEEKVSMDKDLVIRDYNGYGIEYIESDNNDIRIVYEYTPTCDIKSYKNNNELVIYQECDVNTNRINYFIKMINKKVIVDPDYLKIKIYTNKNNINKLNENREKQINNNPYLY